MSQLADFYSLERDVMVEIAIKTIVDSFNFCVTECLTKFECFSKHSSLTTKSKLGLPVKKFCCLCSVERVEVPVEIHNPSAAMMAGHLPVRSQVQYGDAHALVSFHVILNICRKHVSRFHCYFCS